MARIGVKALAVALAAAVGLSGMGGGFARTTYGQGAADPDAPQLKDIGSHWAKDAIVKWEENGLLQGYEDGTFRPDREISRAEFAALLNRLFGYAPANPAPEAKDVPDGAWYRDSLLSAGDAGIIRGDGAGTYRPNAPVTRQEAAVMLDRAYETEQLSDPEAEPQAGDTLSRYADAGEIDGWAGGAVARLTARGALSGRALGKFEPKSLLTRAEALKLIDNLTGSLIRSPGEYLEQPADGSLIVAAAGVTLKDVTVKGDLYAAEGIGGGELTLDGVRIEGSLIVSGGGTNSIHLRNTAVNGGILVHKRDEKVRIVSEDGTTGLSARLLTGAILEGDFNRVRLASAGSQSTLRSGSFGSVEMIVPGSLDAQAAEIGALSVSGQAGGARIALDERSRIDALTLAAAAALTGQGRIVKARVEANGVTFEKRPDAVELAEGVTLAGEPSGGSGTAGSGAGGGQPSGNGADSRLTFGDSADERSAGLTTTGDSGTDTIHTQVGELEDSYGVHYLAGAGSSMTFELAGLAPGKPITLELEEIHTRASGALAYTVLAGGEPVYYRTYEEASAGPNHYFVEVPAELAETDGTVTVTLRNDGDRRVNFGRIWAYSDFEGLAAAEAVNRPMKLGLFQPKLNWNDYAADLALVRSLTQPYEGMSMYKPAIAFDILYMHWEKQELNRRLDYVMDLSRDTGLPVHLSLNSWWGGTPSGPDGQGGYWTDVAYNQIVYDPLNVDGRGNWKLSTPNIWSNTPWLTMNNDRYNEVRADKVREIAAYISSRTAEIKAEGSSIPPVSVFTENEPLYWPYFAFNASPEAGGDFGPEVIAAAARDGVTLDPEDGLSAEEKDWMVRNLTSYIATLSDAIAGGFGYDAIIVDGDRIVYPEDQLVENAYTHMFATPNYPDWDEKRGAWETHMVNGIRYGVEWAGDLDSRYLDYIAARGKYADVNAERSSISNLATLRQAYMYGADYVNIYNFLPNDDRLAREVDGAQSNPVPVPSYDEPLAAYDFRDSNSLETGDVLVATSGVKRDVLSEKLIVTPDNGDAAGGSLTFKADNGGRPLSNGLAVQVQGRALSDLNASCRVEVWAGPDREHLTLVKTLRSFSSETVDVTDAIDREASSAYVELRLYSPGLPSSLYSWTSVWSVKLSAKRDHPSGQADGRTYTVDELRERNLWIGYRADVERLLKTYRDQAGEDEAYRSALRLYDEDRYVSAYRSLTQELSMLLPAKFAVKGEGKLGKYPIHASAEGDGKTFEAVLYEAGPERWRIGLSADEELSVTFTLSDLADGAYAVRPEGSGVYVIARASGGDSSAVQAAGGVAEFTLQAANRTSKAYPSSFEAAYVAKDGDTGQRAPAGYLYVSSQDPAIGEYANYVKLKLAADAVLLRGPDGASDDELERMPFEVLGDGEMLRIEMNEAGEVSRVRAYYGYRSGTITAVEPISIRGELSNAFIEIDGRYRYELGASTALDSPKATGTNILTARTEDLGLAPGDRVTVTYSPYTYNGSEKRAVRVAEIYDTLVTETFETTDGDWSGRAYSVDNIRIAPLDTNYKNKVARPDAIGRPGAIVWKIDGASPFTDLSVEYSGRAIMGNPDSESVKWYVSPDLNEWTEVGGIEPGGDEGNFTMTRSLQLGAYTSEWTTVYIKCELRGSQDDTWASLNDVRIRKKAEDRELAAAELTLGADRLFAGSQVPLALSARYDNGEPVSLRDARVYYEIGDGNLAQTAEDGIKLLKPGTTTVKAYVFMGGRAVVSNAVTLTIESSEAVGADIGLTKSVFAVGDTVSVVSSVYNSDGIAVDPSQYTIAFASGDETVATVSDTGIITGAGPGQTQIAVTVTQGDLVIERRLDITVARVHTIYSSDYAGRSVCTDEAVCNTTAANDTYKVATDDIVVAADQAVYARAETATGVFEPAIRGFYQGLGGPDGTWPVKAQASLTYKLDSLETAFIGLEARLKVRAGVFGSKVIVYAGDTPETADQLVAELTEGGQYKLDLTPWADRSGTVYVKLVIAETAFDWGGIVSVAFDELTMQQ